MSTFTVFGVAHLSVTVNLTIAVMLGALIGLERQFYQRYTGVTTHALVALGAAAFVSIAALASPVGDVTRIAGQVVTGIGFLGAGLIFRDGLSVRGLSAAASLWATGAVGALSGFGLLIEAAEVAILMFAVNLLLPRIGRLVDRFARREAAIVQDFAIELTSRGDDEALVRTKLLQVVAAKRLRLRGLECTPVPGSDRVHLVATVYGQADQAAVLEQAVNELGLSRNVLSARWTRLQATD